MGPREGKAGFRYTYFAAVLGSLTPDHLVLSDMLTQKWGEVPPTRQAEPGSQNRSRNGISEGVSIFWKQYGRKRHDLVVLSWKILILNRDRRCLNTLWKLIDAGEHKQQDPQQTLSIICFRKLSIRLFSRLKLKQTDRSHLLLLFWYHTEEEWLKKTQTERWQRNHQVYGKHLKDADKSNPLLTGNCAADVAQKYWNQLSLRKKSVFTWNIQIPSCEWAAIRWHRIKRNNNRPGKSTTVWLACFTTAVQHSVVWFVNEKDDFSEGIM